MDIFQIFLILFLGVLLSIYVFRIIIEPLYVIVFNKPLYIHWYPYMRKLNVSQRYFLENEFSFYQKLSERKKRFFEHRVASFIAKYQFIGKGGFVVTDQVKIMLAATFVMLTFGMRHYLINNFNKIIIYSEHYYSTIKKQYHKGEFNPKMKVLVFSWKDFQEGFYFKNDNLNLGLHEFSHALYFHCLKKRDPSAVIFQDEFNKMMQYYKDENLNAQLRFKGYFRLYAYKNQFEFLAVILEHFFETPREFKKYHPHLFTIISSMINLKEDFFR